MSAEFSRLVLPQTRISVCDIGRVNILCPKCMFETMMFQQMFDTEKGPKTFPACVHAYGSFCNS